MSIQGDPTTAGRSDISGEDDVLVMAGTLGLDVEAAESIAESAQRTEFENVKETSVSSNSLHSSRKGNKANKQGASVTFSLVGNQQELDDDSNPLIESDGENDHLGQGSMIEGFKLDKFVGKGASGQVWTATRSSMLKGVVRAVKIIDMRSWGRVGSSSWKSKLQRLEREFRVWSSLFSQPESRQFVAGIYDLRINQERKLAVFEMDYIQGKSLADILLARSGMKDRKSLAMGSIEETMSGSVEKEGSHAGRRSLRQSASLSGTAGVAGDSYDNKSAHSSGHSSLSENAQEISGRHEEETKGLGVDAVRSLAEALLESVAALHASGFVHRDIKPDNVMVVGGDEASAATVSFRLIDFGLAVRSNDTKANHADADDDDKMRGEASRNGKRGSLFTMSHTFVGTPEYSAPESFRGITACFTNDVFAVGVVLYEALSGRLPFGRCNQSNPSARYQFFANKFAQVVSAPDIRSVVPNVPERLAELVMRCISVDAALRPQDAEEALKLFRMFNTNPMVHCFVSYRWLPDDKRVATLTVEGLRAKAVWVESERLRVFFDEMSMKDGDDLAVTFGSAIFRSPIVLSVLSISSIIKMLENCSEGRQDNVLVETLSAVACLEFLKFGYSPEDAGLTGGAKGKKLLPIFVPEVLVALHPSDPSQSYVSVVSPLDIILNSTLKVGSLVLKQSASKFGMDVCEAVVNKVNEILATVFSQEPAFHTAIREVGTLSRLLKLVKHQRDVEEVKKAERESEEAVNVVSNIAAAGKDALDNIAKSIGLLDGKSGSAKVFPKDPEHQVADETPVVLEEAECMQDSSPVKNRDGDINPEAASGRTGSSHGHGTVMSLMKSLTGMLGFDIRNQLGNATETIAANLQDMIAAGQLKMEDFELAPNQQSVDVTSFFHVKMPSHSKGKHQYHASRHSSPRYKLFIISGVIKQDSNLAAWLESCSNKNSSNRNSQVQTSSSFAYHDNLCNGLRSGLLSRVRDLLSDTYASVAVGVRPLSSTASPVTSEDETILMRSMFELLGCDRRLALTWFAQARKSVLSSYLDDRHLRAVSGKHNSAKMMVRQTLTQAAVLTLVPCAVQHAKDILGQKLFEAEAAHLRDQISKLHINERPFREAANAFDAMKDYMLFPSAVTADQLANAVGDLQQVCPMLAMRLVPCAYTLHNDVLLWGSGAMKQKARLLPFTFPWASPLKVSSRFENLDFETPRQIATILRLHAPKRKSYWVWALFKSMFLPSLPLHFIIMHRSALFERSFYPRIHDGLVPVLDLYVLGCHVVSVFGLAWPIICLAMTFASFILPERFRFAALVWVIAAAALIVPGILGLIFPSMWLTKVSRGRFVPTFVLRDGALAIRAITEDSHRVEQLLEIGVPLARNPSVISNSAGKSSVSIENQPSTTTETSQSGNTSVQQDESTGSDLGRTITDDSRTNKTTTVDSKTSVASSKVSERSSIATSSLRLLHPEVKQVFEAKGDRWIGRRFCNKSVRLSFSLLPICWMWTLFAESLFLARNLFGDFLSSLYTPYELHRDRLKALAVCGIFWAGLLVSLILQTYFFILDGLFLNDGTLHSSLSQPVSQPCTLLLTSSDGTVSSIAAIGGIGLNSSDSGYGNTSAAVQVLAASGVWIQGPSLHTPRFRHSCLAAAGHLVVFGGIKGKVSDPSSPLQPLETVEFISIDSVLGIAFPSLRQISSQTDSNWTIGSTLPFPVADCHCSFPVSNVTEANAVGSRAAQHSVMNSLVCVGGTAFATANFQTNSTGEGNSSIHTLFKPPGSVSTSYEAGYILTDRSQQSSSILVPVPMYQTALFANSASEISAANMKWSVQSLPEAFPMHTVRGASIGPAISLAKASTAVNPLASVSSTFVVLQDSAAPDAGSTPMTFHALAMGKNNDLLYVSTHTSVSRWTEGLGSRPSQFSCVPLQCSEGDCLCAALCLVHAEGRPAVPIRIKAFIDSVSTYVDLQTLQTSSTSSPWMVDSAFQDRRKSVLTGSCTADLLNVPGRSANVFALPSNNYWLRFATIAEFSDHRTKNRQMLIFGAMYPMGGDETKYNGWKDGEVVSVRS